MRFASFAALLMTASLALLATPRASAKPDGLRVKVVDIMDPTGFEKPMRAASSVIPADWTTEGGVFWNVQPGCSQGQNVQWEAKSADGTATISMLPNFGWQANSMGYPVSANCLNANFQSADQFVGWLVGQMPNGRVVEVSRDPAAQRMLAGFASEMPGDPYSRTWADYASVLVEYSEKGKPYRALVSLMTSHGYMASGMSYGAAMESSYGGAYMIVVFAAPSDRFDGMMPVFHLFSANYKADPQWSSRVSRANRQVSADNARAAAERSRIISQTYSDISDMSMDSWRRRQASEDRLSRESSEAIRGVETYSADTPTGQIELPYGYDSAWQLNDGTFVVTDDAFFDPYRDAGQDGKRLTPEP